jgi:hypothetical protein
MATTKQFLPCWFLERRLKCEKFTTNYEVKGNQQ